ncbi:MAG: ABC transporter substrate-binding protein [Methanomassiliicoccaceae archaeon]|nr:ABC transporter substrate-binding protein [Methanomassiliicoccaceae archaeon]
MKKKQILTIAVAAMFVSVAAIGLWQLWGSEEGYDPGEGVLLSFNEFELEFVTLGERNLTVSQAHSIAMERINETGGGSSGAENWTTLWTMSHGEYTWVENTSDWDELMLKDFRYVSFSKENEKPVAREDALGELIVSLMGPKNRIVVMSPSIKDIVVALGEKDNIAGADNWSHNELGIPHISDVGGYQAANFATIVRANPDLVIVDTSWGAGEMTKLLVDAGLPVIGIDSRASMDIIMDNIINIGYATGSAAIAKEITERMENIANALTDRIKEEEAPSVLMTMNFFPDRPGELFLYGLETPQSNLLVAVGGKNVLDVTGWPPRDRAYIAANFETSAQMIIMIGMGSSASAREFTEDPVFEGMQAVADGNVFTIDGFAANAINRSTPDIVYAMAFLYLLMVDDDIISFGNNYKEVIMTHPKTALIFG